MTRVLSDETDLVERGELLMWKKVGIPASVKGLSGQEGDNQDTMGLGTFLLLWLGSRAIRLISI